LGRIIFNFSHKTIRVEAATTLPKAASFPTQGVLSKSRKISNNQLFWQYLNLIGTSRRLVRARAAGAIKERSFKVIRSGGVAAGDARAARPYHWNSVVSTGLCALKRRRGRV
jgi:hypothetical protein